MWKFGCGRMAGRRTDGHFGWMERREEGEEDGRDGGGGIGSGGGVGYIGIWHNSNRGKGVISLRKLGIKYCLIVIPI